MLKEFKDTFEIKLKNTIKCSKCKKNKEQEDTSYTYTIPHT